MCGTDHPKVNYVLEHACGDNMAGKDISDMSFDEFFLGKKSGSKAKEVPRPAESSDAAPRVDGSRFIRGHPKINVKGGRISLFIPKYEGGRGARYAVKLTQGGRAFDLGNLKSSPLDSDVSSIPTEFDLTESGIDPLDSYVLSIDGKDVYEGFEHRYMMFDADGMPISRAEDTTVVAYRPTDHLWLSDAKVVTETDIGGMRVATVNVAQGGYVRVKDRPQHAPEKMAAPKKEQEVLKARKPSASISLPAPEAAAQVRIGDATLPLYSRAPAVSVELKDAEQDSCVVRVDAPGRTDGVPATSYGVKSVEGVKGEVTLSVESDGKVLAKERFFVIPDFKCRTTVKSDIPSFEYLDFSMGGESYHLDIYADDIEGPFRYDGGEIKLIWGFPVVSVDIGSGMGPLKDTDASVDELPDSIVVRAKGASKKAVFLGGSGKRVNLTPEWDDETIRVDTTPIYKAVLDSPSREVSLYITVNSCPVRRFLTVRNEAGAVVSFSEGSIHSEVHGRGRYVCRVYGIGKAEETHDLPEGSSDIPIGPDAISAELVEVRDGREIPMEAIALRSLPFLMKDGMGDVWLYVSKDKRIPLPDGLLESSSKSPAEIRKWHSQIVRMNPELRKVSPEMMVKAFADYRRA